MRKIFAIIVACVCALLGIICLIDAINGFRTLSTAVEPEKTLYLFSSIANTAYFVISLCALLGTFVAAFQHKKVGHAATWAVLSLSLFVITYGVIYLAIWQYLQAKKADSQSITLFMVCMIVAFVAGGCLLLSCWEDMIWRKFFGLVGSVIGIATFAIALMGIKDAATTAIIVVIGGLVTFVLGFILMLSIPKKDQVVVIKEKK